jgi:hypothetical protein
MTETPRRPLTWLDAFLLAVAFGLGIAWARLECPILVHIYDESNYKDPNRVHIDHSPKFLEPGSLHLVFHLLSTALAPSTWMVAMLGFRRSCSGSRSRFRLPGVAACVAASFVLLGEVAQYPVWIATIRNEIQRLVNDRGPRYVNVNALPVRRTAFGLDSLAGAIAHGMGPHAGLAVAGVLLAYQAARLPSASPCWLNRIGLGLGAFWVASTIAFLARPIGWD